MYLKGLLGDGVVLVPARPRLPVLRDQAVSKHVDVEEDVLLVRNIRLPELDHQLPEDVRRAADEHHWTGETGSGFSQSSRRQ